MGISEFDAYNSFKSLMNYLKTEVEVNPGKVEVKSYGRVEKMAQGYTIKINVSNYAPNEPTWPIVVFVGVNLAIKTQANMSTQTWINRNHYKVDLSRAPQQDKLLPIQVSFGNIQPLSVSMPHFKNFPILTNDEREHGYVLFPGQSIVFETGVPWIEKPNVRDLNFFVQGTLSMRHLLHSIKQIS